MIYLLISSVVINVILAVIIAIITQRNNQLQLKADTTEYNQAIAAGKLNELTLKTFEMDLELEECKRKRDKKGRYTKK